MKKEIKGVLAGAVIAGLLSGAQAWADEAAAPSTATPKAAEGKKDGCQGKHKDSCKGHHKKKAKDGCNKKDGCNGKTEKKAEEKPAAQ